MPESATEQLNDLPAGTQVLAEAPPHGSVLDALPERAFDNLLLVRTSASPTRTERDLRERGVDPSRVGVIPVTGSSVRYDGPLWVSERVSPSDLTGLSIQYSNALQYVREGGWVVFDNLSTLYMYADAERLYRLVSTLTRATGDAGATGVYVVASGVMQSEDYSQLRGVTTHHVEL
ncbi:hypothetical protein [Salarchaeum sp. JOR-1]|uniref:DUF7504 family protein n=1 Tax=Salarchaeum sp. JOR-1 TaxID=2599399 RepID=UPI0011989B48|nr:hypothetical protein [Salarchaeum sp. JOR-1]QDX41252.1 hypothetical protein FQU85_10220 [Salarchaeum sp. JOR-1]